MTGKVKSGKASASEDDGSKGKEGDKPVKVDKWDGSALKNALDDAAKLVLIEKMGYVESHGLTDGRLVICTLSVGCALFALLWDYLYPFPQSRTVLIVCVISYFLMMIVLTLYMSYKERGCFMVAVQKDKAGVDPDVVWSLFSRLKRYDDQYEICLSCAEEGQNVREGSFTKSVSHFFDVNGYLCTDIFDAEFLKLHTSLLRDKKQK